MAIEVEVRQLQTAIDEAAELLAPSDPFWSSTLSNGSKQLECAQSLPEYSKCMQGVLSWFHGMGSFSELYIPDPLDPVHAAPEQHQFDYLKNRIYDLASRIIKINKLS